jgi:hypothetical protein
VTHDHERKNGRLPGAAGNAEAISSSGRVQVQIGRLLNELCASDEEAEQFVSRVLDEHDEWPGPSVMQDKVLEGSYRHGLLLLQGSIRSNALLSRVDARLWPGPAGRTGNDSSGTGTALVRFSGTATRSGPGVWSGERRSSRTRDIVRRAVADRSSATSGPQYQLIRAGFTGDSDPTQSPASGSCDSVFVLARP